MQGVIPQKQLAQIPPNKKVIIQQPINTANPNPNGKAGFTHNVQQPIYARPVQQSTNSVKTTVTVEKKAPAGYQRKDLAASALATLSFPC